MRSKHEAFTRCCFNVGPASSTLAQHWNNIGWMPRTRWDPPFISRSVLVLVCSARLRQRPHGRQDCLTSTSGMTSQSAPADTRHYRICFVFWHHCLLSGSCLHAINADLAVFFSVAWEMYEWIRYMQSSTSMFVEEMITPRGILAPLELVSIQ